MSKALFFAFVILGTFGWRELSGSSCRGIADRNTTKESQLMQCLFQNYKSSVRPVIDSSHGVQINVSFYLVTVAQVYDRENAVLVETYINQNWFDPRLKWDPKEYHGLRKIFVNYWNIWEPELIIWNNRDESMNLVEGKKAVVSYNGEVEWITQMRLNSYCWMDYSHFPFDEQTCHFYLQHHMFENALVNVNLVYPRDQKMPKGTCYSIQDEWNLRECKVRVEQSTWHDINMSFISLEISMERQYSYHYYLVVIPSMAVVLLTLFLLWLPHECSQRFAAAGCMLFAILILNFVLQQFLPPGVGRVPIIASYLLYSILSVMAVAVVSLVTLNFYSKDPSKDTVPDIVKKMFFNAFFTKTTCVLITPFAYMRNASLESKTWDEPVVRISERKTDSFGENTDKLLGDIRKHLEMLAIQSNGEQPVNEWKQLALIIDRLSFCFLFIINIIITAALYAH